MISRRMARNGASNPNFQNVSAGEAVHRGWACLVQGRAELLAARSSGVSLELQL